MHELKQTLSYVPHLAALDAALRASLGTKILGASLYEPHVPISVWMDDTTLAADDTSALSIVAAHDPVSLSPIGTAALVADGVTAITVTVTAPKPGAAAVVLLVNGSAVPVTLVSGVGSIQITSTDPQTITISVQNPANRSTDQLVIRAS